jgi:drug/metabolite transporter (DMT)-like permease
MLACAALGISLSALSITPTKRIRSFSQLMRVGVLSAVFCLTVVLGNVSLKFIPISFNQAIGATTPFFTAIFAFFMQGGRLGGPGEGGG